MATRPRLLVLFGGRSSEHQVSCVSAGGVLANLDPERFDVTAVGIRRDGRWLLSAEGPDCWRLRGRELPEVTDGEPVALLTDPTRQEPCLPLRPCGSCEPA